LQEMSVLIILECLGIYDGLKDINDKMRGHKKCYKERTVMIHQCEYCGKEFDKLWTENRIWVDCGDFVTYDPEDNGDYPRNSEALFTFPKDICRECMKQVTETLNKEVEALMTKDHVAEIARRFDK